MNEFVSEREKESDVCERFYLESGVRGLVLAPHPCHSLICLPPPALCLFAR